MTSILRRRLPRWHSDKESTCQCRRCRFDPKVRKITWSRKWQLTLVTLLGGEGNGTPLQYSCLENPMDGGAW